MEVYVGMDVHRKRSQVAVLDARGTQLLNRNLPNDPAELVTVLGGLASGTWVAFEAAYGWGWLVELLEDLGLEPHLVHPTRCKAIASARLKNDKVDARTLAHLLRTDLLPEAWIAPQHVRDQRALLRHRVALVQLATTARNRVHAVLADRGLRVEQRLWSASGRAWLAALELPPVQRTLVDDWLALIDALDPMVARLERELRAHAKPDPASPRSWPCPASGGSPR
jgi:transposase